MGNLHLPAVLDPILNWFADTLPPPLYDLILKFLSHCLALLSALLNLLVALLSRNPASWDAQTLLPPLISLLAAYLALTSIYRTTSWIIRTSFWFAKWGIILGTLAAGIGWYMGVTQTGVGNTNLISHLGNIVLDRFNGNSGNAIGRERNSRPRPKFTKPNVWESFDRHREWRYNEEEVERASDLDNMLDNLMGMASQVFAEETWLSGLKKVVDIANGQAAERKKQGKTNSKSRSR